LRDCSSFHVALPGESGCSCMVVPKVWHVTHRACPGRFVVKTGWTRVLKNSKSREGGEGSALTAKAETSRPAAANRSNGIRPSSAIAIMPASWPVGPTGLVNREEKESVFLDWGDPTQLVGEVEKDLQPLRAPIVGLIDLSRQKVEFGHIG
jgi:hypothetical protein